VKLDNRTWLEAELIFGAEQEVGLGFALLCKATYDIGEDGALSPALESQWPVHLRPLETAYGEFPGEGPTPKPRTDFMVLGLARAPGGQAVRSMDVVMQLGAHSRVLRVIGDRTWLDRDGELVMSAPEPFTEMPLTWDRAFGGPAEHAMGSLADTNNQVGRGLILDLERAAGTALPNIEDPDALITAPGDRPDPVGFGPYPMDGGLRLSRMARPGEDGKPVTAPPEEQAPLILNWAHPDMTFPPGPPPRTALRVQGMTPEGDLSLSLPPCPGRVTLEYGEDRRDVLAQLDTIILQVEERRICLRWRAADTFPLRPRELRRVVFSQRSA